HIHRRLVGFERDQRRVDFDLFAGFDQHVDDGDLVEIAEIRDYEIDLAHDMAPSRSFGFCSASARNLAIRAPIAPSMTRWSYENDSGSMSRGVNSLPFHSGFIDDFETPRIATSGALMMGVNEVPPM